MKKRYFLLLGFIGVAAIGWYTERQTEARLTELRSSDFPSYLAELKSHDQSLYLQELKHHDRAQWLSELKLLEEAKWEDIARTELPEEYDKHIEHKKDLQNAAALQWKRDNCTVSKQREYAILYANDLVRASLKSPRSAKFPWPDKPRVVKTGQCTFLISSYVDAQNSFGAEIRNRFEVSVEVRQEGWTALDVAIY